MDALLKRAVGLYFLVNALAYIPAGIATLGVQNPFGPSWIVPAITLGQGLVTAIAGFWLYRSAASPDADVLPTGPSVEVVLQLFGVYFVVGGLVSLARPVAGVMWFNESIGASAGSDIVAAAASIGIGACLLARPRPLAAYLSRRRVA